MDGFFYKDEVKPKKERAVKQAIVHELPPVLIIQVPSEKKKEKKAKQFKLDRPQLELDIECYSNYFLVKFRQEDGTHLEYEQIDQLGVSLDRKSIRKKLEDFEIVSFNGNHYDIPMLSFVLTHDECTNKELKKASDDLIKSEMSVHKFTDAHDLTPVDNLNHIDLSPLSPVMASLKLCGARLHCTHLQDLPYAENTKLSEKQMDVVNDYCGNDLEHTSALKNHLSEEIELRRDLSKRYNVDLLSKSDPQIAEEIIKAEVFVRTGRRIKKPKELHTVKFHYKIPDFIQFANPKLNEVLDILKENEFIARPVTSGISMPEKLKKLEISIGNSIYRMGIGGLHSSEKSAFHLSDNEFTLWDWDATSFYPRIMINSGLYPKNIGEIFLTIFEDIVIERIEAKDAGDKKKADSMKITVNGTFGKLGSPYSILYAPELMIQVTITGQLSLLMLIDMLDRHGFDVVSGNTDGVVIKCPHDREDTMKSIIKRWEKRTGFNMESATYAGLYSRDVNNYIGIEYDGKVKVKGCFAYAELKKNPEFDVCTDALIEYLKHGTPVEDTIRTCKDITKFVTIRQVNGGALASDGTYLGRIVRWYYSTNEKGFISSKKNGNKVAASDNGKPIMTLTKEFPDDVNYDWYINKCKKLFY
jgi:hypothetical protein